MPVELLVISAHLNGIAAAPFLILVMLISGNGAIMGDYRNGRLAAVLGWLTAGLMAAAALTSLTVG